MTHEEKRIYLIKQLLKENSHFRLTEIPANMQEQNDLLRSLMNVRPPQPISPDFLKIQDEYLSEECEKRGIVDGSTLPATARDSRLVLWQGDITTLKVDAIVNAANSALLGCFYPLHSCIDNIIHSRSGIQLRLFCNELMRRQGQEEPTGKAKITPAFNLPCRYILHTVGPIINHPLSDQDCKLLASCYRSCLELAAEHGCKSIAFCCISTGEFHFPNEKAAEIAIETTETYLADHKAIERVIFNVFKDRDLSIYKRLLE